MLQALCKAFLYINSIPHNNLIRQVLLWLPFADEKTEAMKWRTHWNKDSQKSRKYHIMLTLECGGQKRKKSIFLIQEDIWEFPEQS